MKTVMLFLFTLLLFLLLMACAGTGSQYRSATASRDYRGMEGQPSVYPDGMRYYTGS